MSEKKSAAGASGRFYIIAAAVLWGLAGVCVKSISWGSTSLVAARSLLSFLVLIAFKRSFKIKFTRLNILGAVCTTATGLLYVQSIKMTTAGTAIVLQYVAPILVFLFAVLFQGRKAKLYEILITLAVFGGIVLSFADSIEPAAIVGNLLGLASGFTFAGQIIVMNREGTDSGDSLIISCILSFLVSFPFVFSDSNLVFDAKNIIWVLILGIFQYGLANAAFSKGIQRIDSVEGSILLTIEPIFNPIPVALFCGETMGPLALAGSAVVVVFVTLYAVIPQIIAKKQAQSR